MTTTPYSSAARRPAQGAPALPRLLLALVVLIGTVGIVQVTVPDSPASAAPIATGTETEIGSAFEDKVLSPQAAHGVGTDGRSLTYFVTSGNEALPALFQAIDTLSGDVVFEQRVPAGIDAWGLTVSGRTVVFTVNDGAARLYSWAPGQKAVRDLGTPFGDDSVWSLTTAPDGTVFAGTYPTGRVFSVDAGTGAVKALGTPNPGEAYVRALAADDRYVYAGSLGTGKLARVDRSTGAISAITLPTALSGTNNTISDLALRGKYLVVTSSSAAAMYLYDTTTGSFAKTVQVDGSGNALPASTTIAGVNSAVSPVHPTEDTVYFQKSSFGLAELDLTTLRYARTGYSTQASPRDMVWVDPKLSGWANPSLAVAGALGTQWLYDTSVLNLSSRPGRQKDTQPQVSGAPGEVRSLAAGPDGKVYVGGFQNPTGVRVYDPAKASFSELEGLPQVEGFGRAGSRLVMGGYPRAQLMTYDPAKPFEYTGATGVFTQNPSTHELKNSQERPFDFVDLGDGTVGVASVSVKSTVGGAFTVWTPNSATTRVYRNPIANQSVVALASANGTVVAGSSINGGTGYEATETKARLFTIDPSTGKVLSSLVPSNEGIVPWVNALSVDPSDGTLWGIAGRTLFHARVDASGRLSMIKQEMIFSNNPGFYGNDFSTFVRDGIVYATADGNLYAINPLTFEKTTLATGGITDMVVIGNRDLYYAKGSLDLFRYRLPVAAPVATPILGSHTTDGVYYPGATVFSGKGTPGSTVTVTVGGTSRTTTVRTDGTWTSPSMTIAAGTRTVSLVAELGGETSGTSTTTLQFSAPIVTPSITSHAVSGEYSAGQVSFSGTGTRGSTVRLTVAGTTVTAPVYSSGQWFAPAVNVPAGSQRVSLTASIPGYTSPTATGTYQFVNDVTPPELTSPGAGSTTSAGTVTLYGTADPHSQVTVTAGGRTVTVPTYSSGMWFAHGMEIPSGTQSISMTATLDGLSSPTVTTTRYFESPVENPALLSPAVGSTTASGMVSFYGTATRGSVVTLTVGGRTVTATTYSSGMWFAPPVQVGTGNQAIVMTASKDGITSASVREVRYFRSAFDPLTITSPAAGSTTASGMVSFYGTATRGAEVTLTFDGRSVTATTYSSGMWFAPPIAVSSGTKSITLTQTVGGQTSAPVTVERSFSSPVQTPTLASPAAGSTTPSGMVSFYGYSTPGATVTLTVGGRTVTAPTYSSGMWFAPPVYVGSGNQSIYLTATMDGETTPTVRTVRYFSA
ncbi:hypothetical protein [Brachybacterium sp. J153]|uniref:hypothetical protein n=1 Tax=Brachybacterium sp. J153 TaxID=3116488 RepID=UPI002E75ACAF|nr:hypothetical protein [Brachybacterium sp. J153]MEE1617847.1 hypothetical protein [Brachybacterium sp. J153]